MLKEALYSLKDERGIALIIALIVMVLITFLGISAIMTSSTEEELAGNLRLQTAAFNAADAGVERALLALPSMYPWVEDTINSTYIFGNSDPNPCDDGGDIICGFIEDSDGAIQDIELDLNINYSVQGKKIYNGGQLSIDRVLLESTGKAPGSSQSKILSLIIWNPGGTEGYGGQIHGGATNPN